MCHAIYPIKLLILNDRKQINISTKYRENQFGNARKFIQNVYL